MKAAKKSQSANPSPAARKSRAAAKNRAAKKPDSGTPKAGKTPASRRKQVGHTGASKLAGKGLHPYNPMNRGYDFDELIKVEPRLKRFVKPNPYGNLSVDFADPQAVKALNSALLGHHYDIQAWDIPEGFLCPPVPGRADYIHHLADLLADGGKIPKGQKVSVLDIGTGANGIYPLVGHKSFGWHFVASDIDPVSLENFSAIIRANKLDRKIALRLQGQAKHTFSGIIQSGERYDASMCNPPFHASLEEAAAGTQKKLKNLAASKGVKHDTKLKLNFGGQKAELWCEGGELRFLEDMIRESQQFAGQCQWFTSLVSKSDNLRPCRRLLQKLEAESVRVIEMHQGNKITRVLAWSFLTDEQRKLWSKFKA
ncbi:23S rRNA (adenine(1618)-N(6))-methyltransferase RlmF [Shewanella corallii]|uniref:Ribosomal RNA large subunit methyltransferase F n=1 Tax=Shewanella corallii TaxID=560080 RepID=A0ABT0NC93_9GAMM|nr:23S rRNA (adenine(1618)-N(6))-methyltransferase RlmF [Shewanella corallii]MCL2916104.1 23S rRNA (adenine(1618)-N(6))-methyltransferase RlmF [Shewanella corallii]